MPITSLQIVGAAGIVSLDLEFDRHFNIICGPNGIGKTTVLESIAHSFGHRQSNTFKRNAITNTGLVRVRGDLGPHPVDVSLKLEHFEPDVSELLTGNHSLAYWLIYLRSTRDFEYQKLGAIASDPKQDHSRNLAYQNAGIEVADIKNWFIQRFLFSAHPDSLAKQQVSNFRLAVQMLSSLQEGFRFKNVDGKRYEIIIATPTGDIPLEYLSSGFRSCVALLFGIIKEIEHRFPPDLSLAEGFTGTILIDEVELHLHPDWQRQICVLLKTFFPAAQFIVSTHSPHVIQTAAASSVIALQQCDGGGVQKNVLNYSDYGFRGWTIEEILAGVMGMETTVSRDYHAALLNFSTAIAASDLAKARDVFSGLDAMLHPSSTMRKILKMQLAGAEAEND